jgi:hypothetical protein
MSWGMGGGRGHCTPCKVCRHWTDPRGRDKGVKGVPVQETAEMGIMGSG